MQGKVYTLDSVHTEVGFKIKHMQISNIKGKFDEFSANIEFDEESKKLLKFNATVEVASINTGNDKRDEHLRSADFFDASKFPQMKFVMDDFVLKDDEESEIYGELTIKDVTKRVVFKYEFGGVMKDDKNDLLGFSLEGEIDRTEFDVGEKSLMVGSEVKISIEVEARAK